MTVAKVGYRLHGLAAVGLLAVYPLPVWSQQASPSVESAQVGSTGLSRDGVRTIQDAIRALNADGPGKSAPARPLGDPAAFFGADAYPPEATRAKEEGRTVARVEIDARGFPTGCTIVSSSNSAALDAATCRIAQTRMQFTAARDVKGRPIASQYTLPVRWMIPQGTDIRLDITGGRKSMIDITVEVGLDKEGRVTSCKVTGQAPGTPDACLPYPVGKQTPFRADRNGAPSPSLMTVSSRVYIDQP